MSRQALGVLLTGVVVAGAAAAFVLTRPAEPPKAVARAEPPATRALVKEEPKVETPAPKPVAPRANAAPAPAPEPAPSAAPAPAATAPLLGVIHFDSDVPGAKVFIDREFVGVAPVTATDLKPGPHRLNVSLPPYEPILETIEVAPGPRDIVFKFKEVRLDAKLDVVHKHRIGSCKGVLVATQHGLRYDTTDKNDAFTATLLDVEAQLDYAEKRLRITVGGKRYDFTDPEGNADRLFVFHRDLEKARDRLKKGDQPAPE